MVVARQGRLPAGADEAVAEAGGRVLVVGLRRRGGGRGPAERRRGLVGRPPTTGPAQPRPAAWPRSSNRRRWSSCRPRRTAGIWRPGWPPPWAGRCWPGRVRVELDRRAGVRADLLRVDGRVVVPVECAGPAVATLVPGRRGSAPPGGPAAPRRSSSTCRAGAGPTGTAARDAETPGPHRARTRPPWTSPTPPGCSAAAPAWYPGRRDDDAGPGRLRPARRGGGRPGGVRGRHPGRHRRRLDRPRAPDRHHRRGRRPRPVRGLRGVGRQPAHRRARAAPTTSSASTPTRRAP